MPAMPSNIHLSAASDCPWKITGDMTERDIRALQARAETALRDGLVAVVHISSACKLLKWTPMNVTRLSKSQNVDSNPYITTQGDNNASRAWALTKLTQGDVELKYLTVELETFMTAPWLALSGQSLTKAQQTIVQARKFYQTRKSPKEAQHAQSLYAATPKICVTRTSQTPSPSSQASAGSKSSAGQSPVTPQQDPHSAKYGIPKSPTNPQKGNQTKNPLATRDQRLATMAPGFFLPGTTLLSSRRSASNLK